MYKMYARAHRIKQCTFVYIVHVQHVCRSSVSSGKRESLQFNHTHSPAGCRRTSPTDGSHAPVIPLPSNGDWNVTVPLSLASPTVQPVRKNVKCLFSHGRMDTMTTYMKIHVYSTLAKLIVEEEKKENPDPIRTVQTRKHT